MILRSADTKCPEPGCEDSAVCALEDKEYCRKHFLSKKRAFLEGRRATELKLKREAQARQRQAKKDQAAKLATTPRRGRPRTQKGSPFACNSYVKEFKFNKTRRQNDYQRDHQKCKM